MVLVRRVEHRASHNQGRYSNRRFTSYSIRAFIFRVSFRDPYRTAELIDRGLFPA